MSSALYKKILGKNQLNLFQTKVFPAKFSNMIKSNQKMDVTKGNSFSLKESVVELPDYLTPKLCLTAVKTHAYAIPIYRGKQCELSVYAGQCYRLSGVSEGNVLRSYIVFAQTMSIDFLL
ncbi:hypothetical protein [Candidatus Enterovibrio escicola]|uniref:hypothetical protein n=1 Tax=Candidatus Enterovibrio escicola TaxID=1927127 RepID=UPI000BE43ACB|nr:hypothetical protein [Candidatus Enterovibrio escacola]